MRTKKKNPIDWLFPEVRKKVLALLLSSPNQRWYLRDIERRTSLAIGTVRRELTGLAEAEIITRSKDGNRTYYQANIESPLFSELSGLLRKTAGVTEVLRKALNPLSKKIRIAFIYGSFAANSTKAASDVDLMVIGSCSFSEVVETIQDAQEILGREINPTVYTTKEWQRKLVSGNHFALSVSGSPHKIFIVGNNNDMGRLAERR